MHEILTFQCGNTANYIGTHFWNFQDPTSELQADINHDVLFSTGQARNGMATYTPRLLIYDQAQHFGSMKRINALYAEPEMNTQGVEVIASDERITEHPFQTSLEEDEAPNGTLLDDSNVRFWSDYNTQFYRPQSYLPLNAFADTSSFDETDVGRDAYRSRNKELDILDSDIRPFLEECDLLQCINVTSAMHDGWSGWTTELIMDLSSEFPKTPRILYATTVPHSRIEHGRMATSLLAIHDEVDAFIPFSSDASWRSSALAAQWIASFTLPFRSRQDNLSVADVTSFLSSTHRIFSPRLSGTLLGPLKGIPPIDRQFRVTRGGKENDLQSKLMSGGLVTTYQHTSKTIFPAAFPDEFKLDEQGVATLEDSTVGSVAYLAKMRSMISGIKGAKGYSDRKDQVEELVELEGRYRGEEFMESDDTGDEDGF